jgi:broad specificity phosphatase PhoE
MQPIASTLRERLQAARRFDAEYASGLSSHLPMALTALARLGADDERLRSFEAAYARRLQAAPPAEPWPAGDAWKQRLGDPRAWPAYRSLFASWIEAESAADVLGQVLPGLMQGVAAAAFHGPIRVAYAISANHAAELGDALAYWACRWFACGERRVVALSPARDPLPALDAMRSIRIPDKPLIALAMAAVAAHPDFLPLASRLAADGRTTLPRLAHLAAERFVAQGGFTTLHLVTSAHAMRVLLPWLDASDRATALADYVQAFAAGWATLPGSAAAPIEGAPLPWPELIARAIESNNDHVIKLVDSCRELERSEGGAVWAQAATRVVARGTR